MPPPAGTTLGSLDGRLATVHAAGAREHPSVDLAPPPFGDHLEGMAQRQAAALAPASLEERRRWLLEHGGPGEIYLAAACERSVKGAWGRFAEVLHPWLAGMLERRGARPAEVESVVGETSGLMLLPPRSGVARTTLGTWDGRARLTSWLAAITLRRWLAQRTQASKQTEPPEVAQASGRRPMPEPLEAALGAEAAERLLTALDAAWEALTARERLALLLRYRGGLAQTRIAALLGVGEPRVSRLLASAIARLRSATEDTLDSALERAPQLAGAVARWLATREGVDAPRDVLSPRTEASRDA